MQFFVTGKIGPKRSTTPEGFLVCHDVPLARTGEQLYRPHEVPDTIRPKPGTDYIRVMRDADEVFHPNAIASLEGKPITIDHPPTMEVTPKTYRQLAHGHVQNVRRGVGAQSDLLLGDLVVKSQEAIDAIEAGMREVSLGYDCGYQELGDDADLPSGLARQYGYIFNHAAILDAGRCGPRCSIADHQPEDIMRTTNDSRGAGIIERLRQAFTSNDARAIEASLASVQTVLDQGGDDGTVVIHNHVPGGGSTANDGEPTLDGAPDWFKAYAKANDRKIDILAGGIVSLKKAMDAKARDDDDDDDDKKKNNDDDDDDDDKKKNGDKRGRDARVKDDDDDDDDDKKKKRAEDEKLLGELEFETPEGLTGDAIAKANDSAFLQDSFAGTIAAAEILAPGIKVPTFDAKAKPGATFDQICGMRRKALRFAMNDAATAAIVETVTNGRMINVDSASCHDVRTVFNAAVGLKKAANNSAVSDGTVRTGDRRSANDGKQPIKSLADLNRHNAERFARKAS